MRAVLTYHSIDDSGSVISTSPSSFERQVAWLASGRVRVVPLLDLVAAGADQDAVAITFDDGFENFEAQAWQRLAAAGLPVTVFVVTGHVGGCNDWGGRSTPGIPRLPLLDWPALARLHAAGLDLGAHTHGHPDLATLEPAACDEEIGRSKQELEQRLGVVPRVFAYPYGRTTAHAVQTTSTMFDAAVTTELAWIDANDDRARLPRLDMYYFRDVGRLEAWGTTAFRARVRARRALRAARALLPGGSGAMLS